MILHDVEQRSDGWYAIRLGKPTASEFSSIVTSKGEESKSRSEYAATLAAELYAGMRLDVWEGNIHAERGREFEDEALARYELANGVTVQRVGFITDDNEKYGCSPDGLVGEDGAVEVKCLKATRHIAAMCYYRKHGRCQPDYIQQTQGQIWISGRKWCDLIFHHHHLPMLVIRQEIIPEVVSGLKVGISKLIAERDEILDMLRSA